MIRVLQCVNNMHRAGLETMLMNYYRSIDRTQIQFDFLMHREERSDYDDEIEQLGGRIFRAPRLYPQNYPKYFAFMKEFFASHPEYKIVHSHIDSMSLFPLLAAKRAGVPVRIAHSHSTSIDRDMKYLLKQAYRFMLPYVASNYCACGKKAGEFLFGKRTFEIMPNAIDAERFAFCEATRSRMRRQLNAENRFVLGHVGRFSYPKNHMFLLEIFGEVQKNRPDSVLLLAGAGEKEDAVKKYAAELGVAGSVRFLGSRADVNDLYQAMDVFVMPSLFEGIPVVGVEAQFAGLPCVFSDRVPKDVAFSENCSFVSLDEGASGWAQRLIALCDRERSAYQGRNDEFDIRVSHRKLEDYYLQLNAAVR